MSMDDLRAGLDKARRRKLRLQALYDKLPTLTFLDPARGCGNVPEIAALFVDFGPGSDMLDVPTPCRVRANQFTAWKSTTQLRTSP